MTVWGMVALPANGPSCRHMAACAVPRDVSRVATGSSMLFSCVALARVSSMNVTGAVVVATMGEMVKNLYTGLYIYAKRGALVYKYTVVMAVLWGIKSRKKQRTRMISEAIGAALAHCEGRKSNSLLQNRDIQHLFRRYFRLQRGRFLEPPRWSFLCSRWSLRF